MGRRLPEFNPDTDGDYSCSKRRTKLLKRVYQSYYHWRSLWESGEVGDVLNIEGEDVYLGDLMVGIDTLPPRQRQAFELICLQGYTESAATAIMLPHSRWSTPVQQYSDDGLKKMITAYDSKQNGTWKPGAKKKKSDTPTGVMPPEPSGPVSSPESTILNDQSGSIRVTNDCDD